MLYICGRNNVLAIEDYLKEMKNIGVILAGGVGNRMGTEFPKQFLPLNGKTVLECCVETFHCNQNIDEICIISHKDYIFKVEEMTATNHWTKVKHILPGGAERHLSSMAAIKAYEGQKEVCLLIHDAARPYVSEKIINKVAEALQEHKAVCVAIASTDTLLETDAQGEYIAAIPNRSRYRRVQTPQGFWLETITAAYRKGLQDPAFLATDDCGVVSHYLPNEPIFIVEGEEENRKITYLEDLK
ncbi:MAG: 2-C-methyl-D-erythritol 4-phosphate cytidylyltransferase [Paludibacteraceae bacterium]|nr:2-C-methyl-D-erythritol 4-phosphate cytidylyltransferase [Paludibacteraceae bacterium]